MYKLMFPLRNIYFLLVILLSVCAEVKCQEFSDPSTVNIKHFNDVTIEHYGPDPCKNFSPPMPDFRAPGRRISEVKCFEYVWQAKAGMQKERQDIECSAIHHTYPVFGGDRASVAEYAHMVNKGALGWRSVAGDWIFKCGASVISEKFALTAAHCSKLKRGDPDIADSVPRMVRLGAEKIVSSIWAINTNDVNIKQIIVHPQYDPPRQYFDIAIIKFTEEVKFKVLTHPACLHNTIEVPEKAKVTGWGYVNLAKIQISPQLQVAEVSLIDSRFCDYLLQTKFNRNWWGTADSQVCAGHLAGGIDTCQGDSGGPLSMTIKSNISSSNYFRWAVHRIIGVTSFGYGCGRSNTPGIYTRVSAFVDWIESIVWPQNQ